METNRRYIDQVALLTAVLPSLVARPEFGLKGGTAINLFIRDLPRLSVDIDLVYLPLQDREASLAGIDQGLRALANEIERTIPNTTVTAEIARGFGVVLKLTVRRENTLVKVEVTPVLRGHVLPTELRELTPTVEAQYGRAQVRLLAFEEIYAGKLCAALDRQHPRDLYDVKILLQNEGVSETLKNVFLVYLMANNRPLVELLDPIPKDIRRTYEEEFEGMTFEPITLAELLEARVTLVRTLHQLLTDSDRKFLLDFKRGNPNWAEFNYPQVVDYPAIRWKMANLAKMNTVKRREAIAKLEHVLTHGPRNT